MSDLDCGVLELGLILPDLQPYLDLRVIAHDGWPAGVPSDSLPLCQDNGNYYFMDSSGTVRYWDYDGGGESDRRATFAEWIIEDWLFDCDEYDRRTSRATQLLSAAHHPVVEARRDDTTGQRYPNQFFIPAGMPAFT